MICPISFLSDVSGSLFVKSAFPVAISLRFLLIDFSGFRAVIISSEMRAAMMSAVARIVAMSVVPSLSCDS